MKKLFIVLLSTLLLISVTACSSSTSAENSTQKGSKYAPGVYSQVNLTSRDKYDDLPSNTITVLNNYNLVVLLPDGTFLEGSTSRWIDYFDEFVETWEKNGKEWGNVSGFSSPKYQFERLFTDTNSQWYQMGTWEETADNEIKLYAKNDHTMRINQNYWQLNARKETDTFRQVYSQYKK